MREGGANEKMPLSGGGCRLAGLRASSAGTALPVARSCLYKSNMMFVSESIMIDVAFTESE